VSVAVIVLELNGHMSHVVPVLVSVILAYIIAELVNSEGFYEMLFVLRGIKQMVEKKGQLLVREVLDYEERYSKIKYLTLEMTPEEVYLTLF